MIQTILKYTHIVSGTTMILKSKRTSGLNKSTSVAAITCRTKDEVVKVLSENRAPIVPRGQPAQMVLPFDHDSNIDANMSDINVRRKSDRRKSFTSSLMARSKVVVYMVTDNFTNMEKSLSIFFFLF